MSNLLFVCTGNAARSVMASTMMKAQNLTHEIDGAGTFSISGLPMSQRTRSALAKKGFSDPDHRSLQLEKQHCAWADLIVVFEKEHIDYIRRHHSEFVQIAGSLPRIATNLRQGEEELHDRILELRLGHSDFAAWEEVIDPAGGDQDVFDSSAEEIFSFISQLALRL